MASRSESPPFRPSGGRRAAGVIALAVVGILALAGCTDASDPSVSASATPTMTESLAPTATPTPTATAVPALIPEGSAEDNLPYFETVVATVWAGDDPLAGRSYVDALVAGGFDKAAMQLTNDETTVGNPAESIQFSVLWGDECLVGQIGPATGDPVAVVLPALQDGGSCLIGETRSIDW